jgi:hypothetical protein
MSYRFVQRSADTRCLVAGVIRKTGAALDTSFPAPAVPTAGGFAGPTNRPQGESAVVPAPGRGASTQTMVRPATPLLNAEWGMRNEDIGKGIE